MGLNDADANLPPTILPRKFQKLCLINSGGRGVEFP